MRRGATQTKQKYSERGRKVLRQVVWPSFMYVGITGTIGSGKAEATQILRRHGFVQYNTGDVLREIAAKRNIQATQPELRMLANELRREHGPEYLARELVKRCQRDTPKHAVFSSIRNIAEVRELRKLNGFVLVSLNAPREVRSERVLARGRRDGITTDEELMVEEDTQLEGSAHEPQLLDVMDAADVKVVNIGNLEEFEAILRDELDI